MILAFHKPYDVLSQFTRELPEHRTLADFGFPAGVYPIGRLDRDSEGLLLLSDETAVVDRLLHPRHRHPRTYWVQIEGEAEPAALKALSAGEITIQGHRCAPAEIHLLVPQPTIPERTPPIRVRQHIPTCWMEMTLTEGKNRQVRRMTAAVGHPTLRLLRVAIGSLRLDPLPLGSWRALADEERQLLFAAPQPPPRRPRR